MSTHKQFIPNDLELGRLRGRILILTGPNMAGENQLTCVRMRLSSLWRIWGPMYLRNGQRFH